MFSQDVVDQITDKTCECLSKLSENLSEEQITLEFGMCMMKASTPYMEELKAEYDIDLKYASEKEGEKLGKVVGIKMIEVCPSYLMLLFKEDETSDENTFESQYVAGKVTKITEKPFLILEVEDASKTKVILHLITYVDTNIDITDHKDLKGENLVFYYIQQPLFDGEKKEFRPYNVLTAIRK